MRRVKVSDGGSRRRGALSLDDCRCPVCLELFLEPVTLPCTHSFCKACFLESVDKATLCCPLCRKRVSTWARLNSRTLVDQPLWEQIQTCFPLQCQRRLSGQDAAEDEPGVSVCSPRVSQPGELKQEYEDQVTKLTEEKRVLDEEERRASEDYIHRLLAEEEDLQQETTRRREEDERLARLLSSQLNSAPVSQENVVPATVTPAKKKKKKKEVLGGQMEKFLCPLPANSSFMANKENILLSQEKVERPTSRQTGASDPPSASVEVQSHALTPGSHMTGDVAKRKSSELETSEEEEETVTKRGCRSIPSSSSLEEGGPASWGIDELEAELLSRRRQEEEDRRLALLLQKELDQQEKQRSTDRRRGSSDPYPLRRSRRESGSSDSPTRPPAKTQRSSTPSSAKTKETPSSSPSSTKTKETPSSSSTKTKETPSSSSTRTKETPSSSSSTKTKETPSSSSSTKTKETPSSSSTKTKETPASSSTKNIETPSSSSSSRSRKQATLTEMFPGLSR